MLKRFRGRRGAARSKEARRDAPGRAVERDFDWKSFDAVASPYERVLAPQTAEVGRDLLNLAEVKPGERVLDVGTGTGAVVEAASEIVGAAGIAAGVDPSIGLLRAGRAARPGVAVAAADVLDLPFFDETFDAELANFALPYFRKLDTSLHDVLRILRPGGRFAASVWTGVEDEFTRTWRGFVEEAVGKEVLRGALKEEAPWTESLADPKRLEEVLRDAGLRPVRVERRSYRFHLSRDAYVEALEAEAPGRFVRSMLGSRLWEGFRDRVRAGFAQRFPEHMVDLRDAHLAVGRKPG